MNSLSNNVVPAMQPHPNIQNLDQKYSKEMQLQQ